MGGGKDTTDGKKIPQQAVIEFLCPETLKKPPRDLQRVSEQLRADEGDEKDKPNSEWEKLKSTEDGHGGTLTFISYTQEEDKGTLHLEWKTKYACLDYDGSDGDVGSGSSGGGWGFFSWIFFLGFVGLIGYFGFFAWINYNKYGATGWDLVPHADTIRDMPYVLSDWGHKVVGSVTGGPSRGGYSAV
jgi:autophagy-related protein 27